MGGWTRRSVGLCLLVTHSRVAGGIKVKEAWQKTEKRLHQEGVPFSEENQKRTGHAIYAQDENMPNKMIAEN